MRLGMRALAATSLVGLGLGFVACTLIVDAKSERQCNTTLDCINRRFPASVCLNSICVPTVTDSGPSDAGVDAPVDPWACLDQPGPPIQDAVNRVVIRRRFANWVSGETRAMTGTVCGAIDATCASAQLGPLSVGADGYSDITVPRYVRGFLSLPGTLSTGADGGSTGRLPTYVSILPVPTQDEPKAEIDQVHTAPLVNWEQWESTVNPSLNLMSSTLKATLSAGQIIVTVFDCRGTPVSGATLKLSQLSTNPKTTPFYVDNTTGLPVGTATATGGNGGAGFVNAPPTNLTLTIEHPGLKRTLGTYTVPVQAGTLTYLPAWPTGT